MIRSAEIKDVPEIVEMLVEARGQAPIQYRYGKYNPDRTGAFLHNAIVHPGSYTIVLEDEEGKICGFLMGDIQPDWLNVGYLATTHFVYSKAGHQGLGLIREFVKWAKSWKKVTKIQITTSFAGDEKGRGARTGKLLTRMGFSPVGKQYVEVI
jgi:GNAT superfamily N-acetyltransferase